jgi:hypothetical protein
MGLVKVLENKTVIRLFGAALILAPFINTAVSINMMSPPPINRWDLHLYWRIFSEGSKVDYFLYPLSIIIGTIMLRGSTGVWKFVLFLLGAFIVAQIPTLPQTMKISWVHGIFFLINISAFLFIADQLVWKVKGKVIKPIPTTPVAPPKTVVLAPVTARTNTKVLIDFYGRGPWAQLVAVSNNGIQARAIAPPPDEIDSRPVQISLKSGLVLNLRFTRRTESDFYFEYTDLTSQNIQLLNQWLRGRAA